MEALILCGRPAAGKTAVANIIASKLHIEAISGGDMLKEMAFDRGHEVTGDEWWDTPDGMKFLAERKRNPDFDKEADRRLLEKIKGGNIVATSYTAPWLSDVGIKCWLEASVATRSKRMAERDGTSVEEAARVVAKRDSENYELYRKMYKIEFGKDMKPFNIIIDVNNITQEQVADRIISEAMRLKAKK